MHRERLSTPILAIVSIIVRAVVIIPRGNDLASFYENSAEGEAHGALRGRILTLRKIKLVLRHFDLVS